MTEEELILVKLKIVSEEKENGAYICDKKHSKILLNYIKQKDNEIERLNNIINKGIEAINIYQNEKTLSVGYEDLKRIRGILRGNEFDLRMFEENLQELKGSGKE